VLSFPALCKTLINNLRHYADYLIDRDQDEGRYSAERAAANIITTSILLGMAIRTKLKAKRRRVNPETPPAEPGIGTMAPHRERRQVMESLG
jgi:hypothetical protein